MSIEENNRLPEAMRRALSEVGRQTAPLPGGWLVGGSTGLLLQGVTLAASPRDLDIYADRTLAEAIHERLSRYSTDERQESETAIYRSVLSHYDIEGIKVELVGAFEVRALGCEYAVEAGFLGDAFAAEWRPSPSWDYPIRMMPLVHELLFNLLRQREDRYEAIGAACRRQPERHIEALEALLARNRFTGEMELLARRLIGAAPLLG
ncbi:hypothetical protein O9H85_10960 [Paenibacillus filicis]|uniref:Nucleotidyl transferase AbiEii/AbiGii toxin family protein n=1 Tax=Paenibacillus gyeongsangnamensis TaxID=3388067 RepID=A0ABT4Q7U4_9BACL|nr:hypothetical protein [Paenibacillus filicis]MCZ8512929.1 hypothetical protein [Paenibacillus filicis]